MKYLFFILVALPAFAAPKKELSEKMGSALEAISSEVAWKEFVANNPKFFPAVESAPSISVVVEKDDIEVKGDKYTVGTAYRQVIVKASPERVKAMLSRPDLFRIMYELDRDTAPDSTLQTGEKLPDTFEADVFKRLPAILPDQDYKLKYIAKTDGAVWFQRVTQIEDRSDFALRETLLAVEATKDGAVFREVGKLYPLGWLIRAMGPKLRSITKDELEKVSKGFICVAESKEPFSKELASQCVAKK